MSRISLSFKTNSTASEAILFINANILTNPIASSILETTNWEKNTLFFTSKFGKGTIVAKDYLVEFEMELNFFGKTSKALIENTISKEIRKLE